MNLTLSPKAKQVIATVAPLLGGALGGPLGAAAGGLISSALGTPTGDSKAAEQALAGATPDQLAALQKANNDFQVQMKQLGVQEEQLQYEDIANARAREEAVKDWTPMTLAMLITVGFFGVLGWMLLYGVPKNSGGEALLVMLGTLGTAWTGVVTYYFGSSIGARKSADALAQIAKQP